MSAYSEPSGVLKINFINRIENLYFTTDRGRGARKTTIGNPPFNTINIGYWDKMQDKEAALEGRSAEEILKSDPKNFAIPKSEITGVRLRKYPLLRARYLTIVTTKKKYRWLANWRPTDS